MNSKMEANSQVSTSESKKQKQNLSKQLEQEQNHRNGDHIEIYQWEEEQGRTGEKVERIRTIIGR